MKVTSAVLTVVLLAGWGCSSKTATDDAQKEGEPMNAQASIAQEAQPGDLHPGRLNHLATETSPYLLQHARNPVNWYPWGKEALGRAKRENKPIFLSIGYSACHWCHVMERESFEDPETAKILNAHFVSIKVDREERPDLDEIYMTAVQAMTGRGGWPLTVFLTPDLQPFFGGTYFPPDDRFGMPSFKKVLQGVADAWRDQPDEIRQSAGRLTDMLRQSALAEISDGGQLDATILTGATEHLRHSFDPQWGGFGSAPKFPPSAAIGHLLRRQLDEGEDGELLTMATRTLDHMARGGMFDQLGGGFHRYSVDAEWLVPHFEKMLYDNAILAKVYLEAWQATGNDLYRRTAVAILDYTLRDMTDADGGFHSAEDADSEGVEGKFYVWTSSEIDKILGKEDGPFLREFYGVTEPGNFEGHNILHMSQDPAAFAREKGISQDELFERLAPMRHRLLTVRGRRVRPSKDDKVLAAWNGMMISALARGYQVLDDPKYLAAARRAADFVLTDMVRDGVLLRSYRDGEAKLPGYLDDYAEMAAGLIDLYEADFDPRWLEAADRLTTGMIDRFHDQRSGGFFFTSAAHQDLLVRTKPFYDGAVPSGNSVAATVLLRLAKLLDNRDYYERAERLLGSMADEMLQTPRGYLDLIRATDFYLHPGHEIAIVGRRDDPATRRLLATVHGRFLPNRVLALLDPDMDDRKALQARIPLLAGKTMLSGKATAYVCENFACQRPVDDTAALDAILSGQQ